jgi:hypothetical protein
MVNFRKRPRDIRVESIAIQSSAGLYGAKEIMLQSLVGCDLFFTCLVGMLGNSAANQR